MLPVTDANFVPSADGHDLEDLTFAGSTNLVKAVIQFATSDFPVGGQQCSGRSRSGFDWGYPRRMIPAIADGVSDFSIPACGYGIFQHPFWGTMMKQILVRGANSARLKVDFWSMNLVSD